MSSPAASAAEDRPRRRIYTQLWFWVIVAIAAGIVFGLVAPATAEKAKWLADAFIQVIQAITGPVIFVTVVVGIASIGLLAKAGGLAVKALAHFLGMTIIALGLGLLAGNLIKPGAGFEGEPDEAARADAEEEIGEAGEQGLVPHVVGEERRQSVGMVIPTGYSFNLDGTCIYLTLGALFIVQAAGENLAIGEQIALAALMILTSKGAAGITGAGLATLVASLQAFGGTFFTPEAIAVGIALVVGIDRVMSEGRALTNCIGNGVATMVIAKWVGERDDRRFQAALKDPTYVEEATERALRGEEVRPQEEYERAGGRFERDPSAERERDQARVRT